MDRKNEKILTLGIFAHANTGWVIESYGVREALNLKPDVEISGGIGTSNDPLVIK